MSVAGAGSAVVVGESPLPGKSNYLLGSNPKGWLTGIPHYSRVRLRDIAAGLDMVFYESAGQLEYDLVVRPGSDPAKIRLRFEGHTGAAVDSQGRLVLHTQGGDLIHHIPRAWQESRPEPVDARFFVDASGAVGVRVGRYDRARTLVIDPVITYSTYAPGRIQAIAVGADGSAYVAGNIDYGLSLPATPGSYDQTENGGSDAFIAKLNPSGTAIEYCTYLGGYNTESVSAIAVDTAGYAYVSGFTYSSDFPVTSGAVRGLPQPIMLFVTKLNAAGNGLVYSATPGGGRYDARSSLAIDAAGNAYVAGSVTPAYPAPSSAFPVTAGAFDTTLNGETDGIVAKLNATGTALLYATYLGGSSSDEVTGIAVDSGGNAYVCGSTASADFPTTPGAFDRTSVGGDVFVARLNPAGSALHFSTYLGGDWDDRCTAIAVDGSGSSFVTGYTGSTDFPVTPGAFRTSRISSVEGYVTNLNAAGSALVYSTLLGGTQSNYPAAIAVDGQGNATVAGETRYDFPTTPGALFRQLSSPYSRFCTPATSPLTHYRRVARQAEGRFVHSTI